MFVMWWRMEVPDYWVVIRRISTDRLATRDTRKLRIASSVLVRLFPLAIRQSYRPIPWVAVHKKLVQPRRGFVLRGPGWAK
jgi:hypothetical protein